MTLRAPARKAYVPRPGIVRVLRPPDEESLQAEGAGSENQGHRRRMRGALNFSRFAVAKPLADSDQ
jgi:hypothetical protein